MTENKIVANNGSSIVLYTTDDGNTQLEVKLEKDTVWLTQNQMAELFGRDRTVITRHIKNIFKEGELDENITCAKFAHMGADQDQTYETKMYSLDVIISVGYRVKSINGTKFRIWANSILKQYLIRGYTIDQRRLDHYDELKDVVRLMSRALTLQDKVSEGEYSGLFCVITDYVYALDTLDRYDYQASVRLKTSHLQQGWTYIPVAQHRLAFLHLARPSRPLHVCLLFPAHSMHSRQFLFLPFQYPSAVRSSQSLFLPEACGVFQPCAPLLHRRPAWLQYNISVNLQLQRAHNPPHTQICRFRCRQ